MIHRELFGLFFTEEEKILILNEYCMSASFCHVDKNLHWIFLLNCFQSISTMYSLILDILSCMLIVAIF